MNVIGNKIVCFWKAEEEVDEETTHLETNLARGILGESVEDIVGILGSICKKWGIHVTKGKPARSRIQWVFYPPVGRTGRRYP